MTDHQTAQRLLAMEDVLILTHRRPDGDTIGCACALCLALRQLGKTAWVLPNEDAHGLFTPYFEGVLAPAEFVPQFVVSVDTAALGMLPGSGKAYADRIDLAIDHHGSNEGYAKQTRVDPDCAACAELLYRILVEMGVRITAPIALLLYMAIATDTGCFVYSNTTPDTHRIAAALMETGFDAQWVNKRHFRVKSLKRMQIESRLVREMDLAQNGTLVFAYVTLDLIRELEATEEDLEDISAFIGQLEGVDNAVTIRQLKPEECKISLRTDGKTLNASAVCAVYGGGGHAAAAGCTIQGTPAQAKAAMMKAIEQVPPGERYPHHRQAHGLDQPRRGGQAPGDPARKAHRPRGDAGPHGHRCTARLCGPGYPRGGVRRRTGKGIPGRAAPGAGHGHPRRDRLDALHRSRLCDTGRRREDLSPIPGRHPADPPHVLRHQERGQKAP